MCVMYMSRLLGCWSCLCLVSIAPAYHSEVILLTACLTKCLALPLHVCCTTVFTVFYSVLTFLLFGLTFVGYLDLVTPFYMVKVFHAFHVIQHFFCALHFHSLGPLAPADCLLLYSFGQLVLLRFTVCTIYELLFDPSTVFFTVTFCSFYMESAHLFLHGFIIFYM